MRDSFKLLSGVVAIGIYLFLAGTVLYYFNYRSADKPVHYVKKNSDSIAVSLAGATQKTVKTQEKKKASHKKPKHRPKKVRNITSKKPHKQKSKHAKKPAKKIKTKSLFASVDTSRKPAKKKQAKASQNREKSATQRISDSLKKHQPDDKGVKNKYFAAVEEKLRGWPSQANYAGEQISVWLKVYSNGSFEFKVQKLSANSEFNEALIAYLKQLQSIGLGRHKNAKPYEIEVEFEATG